MARYTLVVLFLLVSLVASLQFGFEDDDEFFDDFEQGTDKRGLKDDGSSPNEGETIFVSESKNKLSDGRESITKESVKWEKNKKTGEWSKKRVSRHFMRLENGTVLEMEDNGSGDVKKDGEATKVDCINEEDCKEEQFCDSLSYACKDCLKINETCHKHKQCCKGFLCREGKCEAITGKENDPCESDKDCQTNHCCAYNDGREVCKPFLREKESCGENHRSRFPSFFASRFLEEGKKTRCPCLKGLKCKKQRTFFLYNNQVCVRQHTKKEQKKRNKKQKKETERENEMYEMERDDDDNDDEMDFFPENGMEEMQDNLMDEAEEDEEDPTDNEGYKKRSIDDDSPIKGDEKSSIFEAVPKILNSFLRGILDNFE